MDDLLRSLEDTIVAAKPKRQIGLQLLYKASSHGYSVDTFHERCDNKGPTITLLHGVKNTWYGGYTSQSWTSEINKYVPDPYAFLFWKQQTHGSPLHTMHIKHDKIDSAIRCDIKVGPTFGWSGYINTKHDLQTFTSHMHIRNEREKKMFRLDGHLNVGGAYDKGTFTNDQINGGTMKVNDLEVYHVYDDEVDPTSWFQEVSNLEAMRRELEEMKPLDCLGIACYNILLLGVIGSGKSSLCNTVRSTFLGNITKAAAVGNLPHSITSKLDVYQIPTAKRGRKLNIQLTDVRGVQEDRGYDHEIEHLLQGTLRRDYSFPDKACPVEEGDIAPHGGLKNEIHLVCFVADATKLQVITEETRDCLLRSQQLVQKKGIPRMCVLTKIDELCPNVARDIKHVYKSKRVHDAIKAAAQHFGMHEREVFPVCNYTNEKDVDTTRDCLVIQAMNGMFQMITGSLSRKLNAASKVDHWARRGEDIVQKLDLMKMRIAAELDEMNTAHNIRLLLLGNINSGKSSFVNTITSAFRGDVRKLASVGTSEDGTTWKYREYKQKLNDGGRDRDVPITICDIPGFGKRLGPSTDDIECIVQGHVSNNTEMTSKVTPDTPRYRQHPNTAHKMHCVCFVYDISQMESDKEMQTNVKTIVKMLKRNDVPNIAILTKCDMVWPGITTHLQDIYASRKIEECAESIADLLDITKREIYPVVNYVDQTATQELMDVLALESLHGMVAASRDFLEICGSDAED